MSTGSRTMKNRNVRSRTTRRSSAPARAVAVMTRAPGGAGRLPHAPVTRAIPSSTSTGVTTAVVCSAGEVGEAPQRPAVGGQERERAQQRGSGADEDEVAAQQHEAEGQHGGQALGLPLGAGHGDHESGEGDEGQAQGHDQAATASGGPQSASNPSVVTSATVRLATP